MYSDFISLGWYCGVASSMSKNGIRSISGPFDWYFSSFEGVLKCLDTDFECFLNMDNLVHEGGKLFVDKHLGFRYPHEIKESLEHDFDTIKDKYCRRIERLLEIEKSSEGICFLRAVRDEDELDFIVNNKKMIDSIIRKHNHNNDIVYLIPKHFLDNNLISLKDMKYFILPVNCYYGILWEAARGLFDRCDDLKEFIAENYDHDKQVLNIVFDRKNEEYRKRNDPSKWEARQLKSELQAARDLDDSYAKIRILSSLLSKKLISEKLPKKVVIYGAGDLGKAICTLLEKEGVDVEVFIDADVVIRSCMGRKVIRMGEMAGIEAEYVINTLITPVAQDINEEIHKTYKGKLKCIDIRHLMKEYMR